MGKKENEFLKRLLVTFAIEAQEHLNALSSGLVALEKAPVGDRQMAIIETIFREAHSLKGAARAVNLTEIEVICQSLESVFAAWKRQEVTTSSTLFDVLHQVVDRLGQLLVSPGATRTSAEPSQLRALLQRLQETSKGILPLPQQETVEERGAEHPVEPQHVDVHPSETMADLQPVVEGKPAPVETVRISAAKLDAILLQVEELLSAKLATGQRTVELRTVTAVLATWDKAWATIRPDVRAMQQSLERDGQENGRENVIKLLEFLEWTNSFVRSLDAQLVTLTTAAEHDHHTLGGMVDTLLSDMKKVLMLPFSAFLEIVPKLVRDISRDRGKEVEVVIQGSELEIDRRILEAMKDPLIHLIRNGIDHGIEKPEERERKQKPSRGTITIAISQKNGSKVEILIADDGAGINIANVRSAAIKRGLISQEEADRLTEQEVVSLVFQSGVSTSPIITDLSGRGLGLAIVQEKVENLGGVISVETESDVGTTFRIVLPLTLATFRGVLVRVDDRLFVFPTSHVERVVSVDKEEIKTVENRETIQLNGQAVSLVRLGDALELPSQSTPGDSRNTLHVIVLTSAEKRIAFLVDEILNEQEILVKPLGKQLSRVRNIAGATVLGTGKVVPILNVSDLMKSAVRVDVTASKLVTPPAGGEEIKKESVLVVEDSITARTLLKNILEAAGYDVRTAIDGVDGLTQLRTGQFDLVVSDVDMPRMNGFDLTAKIRADKKLSELPLVLVTALESREDRERGIDVGANAYIVKSSFDQSNLLEVIRRLI